MAKRVLVVDDHSLFRDGIISLLKAAGMEVVGEATEGQEAVSEVIRLCPDLVLLDISMPGMNGLEALRQIRAKIPETQVVMLTVSDEDEDLIEAIKFGARGYLLKSQDGKGFITSLRCLERGEAAITRQTTTRLIDGLARLQQLDGEASGHDVLTQREVELLRLVAVGLSNKVIGQRLGLTENTVKYHMKNILNKLGLQNRAEAAAFAVRNGLVENPGVVKSPRGSK